MFITFTFDAIDGEGLAIIRKVGEIVIINLDSTKLDKLPFNEQNAILAHEMQHLMIMEKQERAKK